ncbi:MAG TPA: hypothetical protein PLL10_01180 [Elusimicrobiales bacterium]|nr:hypothetical protein [Elusimicrobiales bacterium]
MSLKDNIYFRLGLLAAVSLGFSLFYALPYRFFPAYDMAVYEFAKTASLSDLLHSASPVHAVYLAVCLKIWGVFSSDGASALAFAASLANAVSVFLCGTAACLLTSNRFCALFASAIYACSAWPLHYLFSYSCAPLAAVFVLATMTLLIKGRAGQTSIWWLASAGVVAGLSFWTAPFGPLFLVASAFFAVCLCWPADRDNIIALASFLFAALIGVLVFWPVSAQTLMQVLRGNFSDPRYAAALDKLGHLPSAHMLFLRTLWVYSPWLALGIATAFLLRAVPLLKPTPALDRLWGGNTILSSLLGWLLFVMLAFEFLPFSATAKVQFPAYGVALLTVVLSAFAAEGLFDGKAAEVYRKLKWPALALVCFGGLFGAADNRLSRRFAPDYFASLMSKAPVVVLAEDPHRAALSAWLSGVNIKILPADSLASAAVAAGNDGLYLLLGPAGAGSGLSATGGCVLEDFSPALESVRGLLAASPVFALPYYAASTPELLESPVCQPLYFSGALDKIAPPARGLTLYQLLVVPKKKDRKPPEVKHVR